MLTTFQYIGTKTSVVEDMPAEVDIIITKRRRKSLFINCICKLIILQPAFSFSNEIELKRRENSSENKKISFYVSENIVLTLLKHSSCAPTTMFLHAKQGAFADLKLCSCRNNKNLFHSPNPQPTDYQRSFFLLIFCVFCIKM